MKKGKFISKKLKTNIFNQIDWNDIEIKIEENDINAYNTYENNACTERIAKITKIWSMW